jgi:hypothetical protein
VSAGQVLTLERVVMTIEAHVDAHPLAIDSAAGVARWWVGMTGGGGDMQDIEQALSQLVERRVLRRLCLADGSVLYARPMPTRQ